MVQTIDPRITFYEASYLFQKVDQSGDGKVSLQEFKGVFNEFDFCDINDKASQIIIDFKEIMKNNNMDLETVFKKYDNDGVNNN